jgi:hypothetical protein
MLKGALSFGSETGPQWRRPVRHLVVLDAAIQARGCFHFKTIGDAVQVAPSTAPAAVGGALAAQRALLRGQGRSRQPTRPRAKRRSRHDPISCRVSPLPNWDRQDYLHLPLEADELEHSISNNPRRFWDIEHARRILGYDPHDATPVLIGDEEGNGTS